MRKSLIPFAQNFKRSEPKALGGARSYVQGTAQRMADAAPMNVARIYSPGAIKHYDDSDPRFAGKSDQVENIYLAPVEVKTPRSGIAQIFNWLTKGRME